MTKAEFLTALRSKLTGEVSAAEVENTIRYYDEYISDAVRQGKTEEEVLGELGSPLLIAKTIIDTAGNEKDDDRQGKTTYSSNESETGTQFKHYNINPTAAKVVTILIIVVVLFLAFTILRVLLPIILPILVIWMILSMFRNGGSR